MSNHFFFNVEYILGFAYYVFECERKTASVMWWIDLLTPSFQLSTPLTIVINHRR